jgi:hypothetical protein
MNLVNFMNLKSSNSEKADRLAIVVSILCCIHCLATPLLLIFTPWVGQYFNEAWVHIVFAVFVVPLGIYAFVKSYKIHKDKRPFLLGISGMIFLLFSIISHEFFSIHIHFVEEILSFVGGAFLIVGHYLNIKQCACHHCHDDTHHHH